MSFSIDVDVMCICLLYIMSFIIIIIIIGISIIIREVGQKYKLMEEKGRDLISLDFFPLLFEHG